MMPTLQNGEPRAASIELEEINKTFGETLAVDDVTLYIEPGEFVSLLGPSGCGKTTTLRMVAGFETPDHGEIKLDGEPIIDRPPHQRDTSMVFQDYALFPHKTVSQNIAFGLRMRKTPKSTITTRVDEMLDLLDLSGMGDRKPEQLSGGQQQRVALGRALVIDPKVLLLDEPLGALDLQLRKQMQLELKRIQREVGITFVYVTHDQEEALTMSDRIAVMNAGRVEQYAPATDIYRRPATPFVARFIGEANFLAGVVRQSDPERIKLELDDIGQPLVAINTIGQELPSGHRVLAVVRPENVAIGPQADGAQNTFDFEIDEVIFAGAFLRLIGHIGHADFRVTASQAGVSVSRGDSIQVGWDPESVVLVDQEDEEVPE